MVKILKLWSWPLAIDGKGQELAKQVNVSCCKIFDDDVIEKELQENIGRIECYGLKPLVISYWCI